ncbi:MAG: 30S ribosomal protein S9 [bacterium]|nr:30S ribosomal protein S9 [bacterium]
MAIKKSKSKVETKETKEKEEEKKKIAPEKYFYAVGRRKTSVAQVRLYLEEKAGDNDFIVNNKKVKEYFPTLPLQNNLFSPLKAVGLHGKFRFSILVKGGGTTGQSEAARLGIARALAIYDSELTKTLRDIGFLTRDSRKVERKKPGLKKARRAPQWQKR